MSQDPDRLREFAMKSTARPLRAEMDAFRGLIVQNSSALVLEKYDSFHKNVDVLLKAVEDGKVEPFDKVDESPVFSVIMGLVFGVLPWGFGIYKLFWG